MTSPGDAVGSLARTELTVSVAWQSLATCSDTILSFEDDNRLTNEECRQRMADINRDNYDVVIIKTGLDKRASYVINLPSRIRSESELIWTLAVLGYSERLIKSF